MKISHIALWTQNLEEQKRFYEKYFNGISNEKYSNPAKGFESYFIYFSGDTSLEIMRSIHIHEEHLSQPQLGFCHVAFQLDDRETVIKLTELLRLDGYQITGEPRITGDGYFESVILDPDGNQIELVAQ